MAVGEAITNIAAANIGEIANIKDLNPEPRYDVVCLLGVLEYSELFMAGDNGTGAKNHQMTFDYMLAKAAAFLRPKGVLIVAIENQLGLKYWSGAAEDHTGMMFVGISGYSPKPSPCTFSRRGLLELLKKAGFDRFDEFYPFPDYKVPVSVPRTVGSLSI